MSSSSAPAPVASLGGGSATEIVFFLNGKKVVEPHLEPDLSLIQYLRTGAIACAVVFRAPTKKNNTAYSRISARSRLMIYSDDFIMAISCSKYN
jgi:hypothetical protein